VHPIIFDTGIMDTEMEKKLTDTFIKDHNLVKLTQQEIKQDNLPQYLDRSSYYRDKINDNLYRFNMSGINIWPSNKQIVSFYI
jgi:hypothetical protein